MKKNKLLTLGFTLPALAVAIVPAVACTNNKKVKQPTIVEQENITVSIDSFELNKDLVLSYKLTSGYQIDKTTSEIKVDDTAVSSSKIDYQDENKKVVVDASVVTSGNISIKLCAKKEPDVGVELIFDYDPETINFAYDVNDTLDLAGVKVTEKFKSGVTKDIPIDQCTTIPAKGAQLKLSDSEVKIQYDGLTCSYPIYVTKETTKEEIISTYQNKWDSKSGIHEIYHWQQLEVYGTYDNKQATDCWYGDSPAAGNPYGFNIRFGNDADGKIVSMGGGSKYEENAFKARLQAIPDGQLMSYTSYQDKFMVYKIFDEEQNVIEEVIFNDDLHVEYYYEKDKTSESGIVVLYSEE